MKRFLLGVLVVCFLSVLILNGCKSVASQEELKQLQERKDQIAALEKKIGDLEQEKADLKKAIAAKDVEIQKCQADHKAIDEKMKSPN